MRHSPSEKIKPRVAISWWGLPAYGARLVQAGIERFGNPVDVLGTRAPIPIRGMEEILGQKVHWIEEMEPISWADIGLPIPDLFFQAGWHLPSFMSLGREVKKNGGKVVLLSDNAWKCNFRQLLGAVKFRLSYRRLFSAVWVPGQSGYTLQRFLGMPSSTIYQGLYGSDPNCFTPGPPLTQRNKQFIFVGKLTLLKGIPTLAKAFDIFHHEHPEWKLIVYGDGPCRDLLDGHPGIEVRPFAQPPQIAESMRQSRFFVLPTLTDNWPLVVSEATLTGCGLLLSDRVGNIPEFLSEKNGFVFPANNAKVLAARMYDAASLSDPQLDEAYAESTQRGSIFVPSHWATQFEKIVCEVGNYES